MDGEAYARTEQFLRERLGQYHELMARPYVQGRDLAAAGVSPGPEYAKALAFAHKLRLAGVEKDNALRQTLSCIKSLKEGKN